MYSSRARAFVYIALILTLLQPRACLFACDSTMLSLLSGENPSQTLVSRLLSVSQGLQSEADMLNGFNKAAAKALHKQIMLDWLHLAPELIAEVNPKNEYKSSYTSLIKASAKDLGDIKRSLDSATNPLVQTYAHDIIEKCVTQISLLGAIINENKRMCDFLKGELELYTQAIYINGKQGVWAEANFEGLKTIFDSLSHEFSKNALNSYNKLAEAINTFSAKAEAHKSKGAGPQKVSHRVLYNNITNAFVEFKQKLLEDGYFAK